MSHEEKVDIGLNKKESSIRNKTDAKEEPKEEGAPDAKASSDFQAFSSPHKQSKFDKSDGKYCQIFSKKDQLLSLLLF